MCGNTTLPFCGAGAWPPIVHRGKHACAMSWLSQQRVLVVRKQTAVTWGCVRAFQQVSSILMNGLKNDAGAIQNLVVLHRAAAYPARLAHVGLSIGLRRRSDGRLGPQATSTTPRTDARQRGCSAPCVWDRGGRGSPASSAIRALIGQVVAAGVACMKRKSKSSR